jgi:hypothetical protein
MNRSSRRSASVALAAVGVTLGAVGAARADPVLPVTNLNFEQFSGTLTAPKTQFSDAGPTGWSTGTGSAGNLIGVGNQGSETVNQGVYDVYEGTGFSVTVPAGTNFYQADGNPLFEDTILQSIPHLTAGTAYSLQFQQAAGQETGFSGATTEQWKVFLGVGGIGTSCPQTGNGTCSINGTADNIEEDSTLMHNDSQSNVDWNNVNLSFTLTPSDLLNFNATNGTGTGVLSFLAWGNGGNSANEPPTVFLEGVNTTPIPAPEPAALSLLGIGVVGIGGIVRRRRAQRNAAN